jgi:hypothetical protein
MTPMGQHSEHYAAGAPLRRARASAWVVTVAMGGTTMAFQVYHSVKLGHMPWELAVLYGIVPLLIAVLVLEIVAEWRGAPWSAKAGAYLIMGAAMFLSASATGAVVLHAAPAHWSLLFGALLDGAELLAAYFIMNGPAAAQAVASVAKREAELTAAIAAERAARDDERAGHMRLVGELAETATAVQEHHERVLAEMRTALGEARREAETAAARAEASARKLAAVTGQRKAGNGTRKPAGNSARKPEPAPAEAAAVNPDDLPGNWDALDTEARVLALVDKGYSASKAGLAAGVTDARGRQIARLARDLSVTAPQDVVGDTTER